MVSFFLGGSPWMYVLTVQILFCLFNFTVYLSKQNPSTIIIKKIPTAPSSVWQSERPDAVIRGQRAQHWWAARLPKPERGFPSTGSQSEQSGRPQVGIGCFGEHECIGNWTTMQVCIGCFGEHECIGNLTTSQVCIGCFGVHECIGNRTPIPWIWI